MSWEKEAEEIKQRRAAAKQQGGAEAVEKQHARGRLTIRERIGHVLDDGSFAEMGEGAGHADLDEDGNLVEFTPPNYVLGFGKIDGRPVVVGGEDFTLKGGSPNPAGLRKSVYSEDLALQYRYPLVRMLEGGGGSVAGAAGNKGKGGGAPRPSGGDPVFAAPRFMSITNVLGQVPVASAALGPVAGFPAARLAASHFSVMTKKTAQVLVAGPAVVERALGRALTKEELGGADVHLKSGVVDNVAKNEEDALNQIRQFLSYLPSNVGEMPPVSESADSPGRMDEELISIVPRDRRKPYKVRVLIKHIVDQDSFFEMGKKYGSGQVTGFARLNGYPVGVLANDCTVYAGAMTAAGAQKVRRFVDLCETFHVPVVSLVDEPGFMIGPDSEAAGTIRYGTATIAAVMQSRVPWASVIIKKVFGVAGAAHFGPNSYTLAWPSAEMGALPVEGGVAVAFGRQIAAAEDPDKMRAELEAMLAARQSPFPRAEAFGFHELIDPRETRPYLCQWVERVWPLLKQDLGSRTFTYRP